MFFSISFLGHFYLLSKTLESFLVIGRDEFGLWEPLICS